MKLESYYSTNQLIIFITDTLHVIKNNSCIALSLKRIDIYNLTSKTKIINTLKKNKESNRASILEKSDYNKQKVKRLINISYSE